MPSPSPTHSAPAPRPRASVAAVLRGSGATAASYTARQFAGWLGLSEKAIKKRLPDTSAACDVRGQKAKAWPVEALPVDWRERLQALATERGYRSVHDLLNSENNRPRWTPDKPWTAVEERFQKDAIHWRDALSDIMPRWVSGESRSELLILAAQNYLKAAKREVASARIEYVVQRTDRRDAGQHEFSGPSLYLDGDAFKEHRSRPDSVNWYPQFQALKELRPQDPESPTNDDRGEIFQTAFEQLEKLHTAHPDKRTQRQIARALADFLIEHFPKLARTADSLRAKFRQDIGPWIASGRSFEFWNDRRKNDSGYFRRPDFSRDHTAIAKLAWKLDGNESGARRMLEDQGKLSPEFVAYEPLDQRANKSALSKATRRAVTGKVEATLALRSGQKAFRDQGPTITRDWSDARPGDRFVFDDVKFNHYFKFKLPDGRWDVTCGECLAAVDELTDYPLPFLLLARTGYNGLLIRRHVSYVHDRIGLPHTGFVFEGGAWDSKFVTGDKVGWDLIHKRDFERGLNDPRIGIKIHRARVHRGKTIEGWFHHLQDRMRCIFGFIGFNERADKIEHMQKLVARARRQDADALAQFLTQEQWRDQIVQVMEEYSHTPRNGNRLPGRTPAEEWNEAIFKRPLRKLSEDVRHILDTHTKIARLDPKKGIVIKIPGYKNPVCYCNEHTAALAFKGEQQVRVRIDLEHPDRLTVSDMKETLRFAVRGQMAHATNASREELAALAKMRRAHQAPAKALWGEIQQEVRSIIVRDDQHDEATKEDGRFHREAMESFKAEQSAEVDEVSALKRRASKLGLKLKADLSDPRQRRAVEMELKGRELQLGNTLPVTEE